MNKLLITKIEPIGNVIKVHFKCKGKVKKFFNSNTFFVKYDTSIENVPESILIIPFLSTVCPIVWACKADIYIENIDEKFYESLKKIKKTLQKFYPKIGFKGSTHAKNITKTNTQNHTKSMMLFSGGADSILTYIKHEKEKPVLVVINGADIHIDNREAWNTVLETSTQFANQTGAKLRSVESNFRSMLNELMLAAYYDEHVSVSWWGGVMHGLSLIGLCSPLTYVDRVEKIYLASSYTEEFSEPWGSHPEIDNNIEWTGTKATHDGYDLSRQEKLFEIAKYIKEYNKKFVIRTCWEQQKDANCGVCEKCVRSILGLELAGIDPNTVGYDVDADKFRAMKGLIENAGWFDREGVEFMWKDIQTHFRPDQQLPHPEAKEIMEWLVTVDIKNLKTKTKKSLFPNYRFVYRKYLPYSIYNLAQKIVKDV